MTRLVPALAPILARHATPLKPIFAGCPEGWSRVGPARVA
jgi:hypothetical protein